MDVKKYYQTVAGKCPSKYSITNKLWSINVWLLSRGPFSLLFALLILSYLSFSFNILSNQQIIYFLVGGTGVVISLLTYFVNKTRINLDLFEKRYQIYKQCRQAVKIVIAKGTIKFGEAIELLKRSDYEAVFFFDEDTVKYIDELYIKCIEIKAYGDIIDDIQKYPNDSNTRTKAIDQQYGLLEYFTSQDKDLPNRFKKYLSFQHVY